MRIDPELARTLLTLSETGSVSATAEILHVTQSAISSRLRRLSKITGGDVVRPSGRGVTLTVHGSTVVQSTKQLVEAHDDAVTNLTSQGDKIAIRILANEAFFTYPLADLTAAVNRELPQAVLHWTIDAAAHRPECWPRSQFDLITHQSLTHEAYAGDIVAWEDHLEWVQGVDHHISAHEPVPLVTFGEHCFYRPLMRQALDNEGRDFFDAVASTGLMGVEKAVAAGLGVAVINSRTKSPFVRTCPPAAQLPPLPDIAQIWRINSKSDKTAHQIAQLLSTALSRPDTMSTRFATVAVRSAQHRQDDSKL